MTTNLDGQVTNSPYTLAALRLETKQALDTQREPDSELH